MLLARPLSDDWCCSLSLLHHSLPCLVTGGKPGSHGHAGRSCTFSGRNPPVPGCCQCPCSRQKTGHKVQVNCRALLHWTSGHEWTDCPLTLTALGSWWKIQHFPCWHSCFGEFSRASWIILRKFHCSNLYLWEQLVLKGICCTRCAGGPPVGSCYSYNICPWKLSSAARSYRQDC